MSLLAQDERLTQRVGAIVIALLVAAIAFFVFFADRIEFGPRTRITVYFEHTGGLREGAPVIVGGRTVGRIESITLTPKGGTAVHLSLTAMDLPRGGDIFVAGRGPLSARHLEIGPSRDPDGPRLATGDEVRGVDPPTLDRVLNRTWDNLTVARRFAEEVAPEFRELRDQLRALAATLDELAPDAVGRLRLGFEIEGLLAEARQLRDVALGGDAGLARIAGVIDRARTAIAEARAMIDGLRGRLHALTSNLDAARARLGAHGPGVLAKAELALERIQAAADRIEPLLASARDLMARLERGEGSLGRLSRDPEFPEDAKELGKILKRQPWRIFARPKD